MRNYTCKNCGHKFQADLPFNYYVCPKCGGNAFADDPPEAKPTLTIHPRANDGLIVVLPKYDWGNDQGFLTQLEKAIDAALVHMGYTRTGEDRDDSGVVMHYFQFGVAL